MRMAAYAFSMVTNGKRYHITEERIGVGASNMVGIIDVGVDACGILSRSVGQTNRKYKYGGHLAYKMQKINGKRRQIAEILHCNRKSGSANRMAVSKFTPEVYKYPFLRMRSTNVAENGRKRDYMLNF